MKHLGNFVAVALTVVLPLAACDNTGSLTAANSGKVSVYLTDAPGDVQAAVVTITGVYLQGGSAEAADSTNGRVYLTQDSMTVDLLDLQNQLADLATDVAIPAGTYSQLRILISGGYIEVANADGSTSIYATSPDYAGLPAGAEVDGTLQMPSFQQSGLKVELPGGDLGVAAGGEQQLVVDFDVSQSFGHQAGKKWVMHPVVRATSLAETAGIEATLALGSGITLPDSVALTDFTLHAVANDTTGFTADAPFTIVDDTARAAFHFERAGETYTLTVVGPAGLTLAVDPASAEVTPTAGDTAEVAFTLTAITGI